MLPTSILLAVTMLSAITPSEESNAACPKNCLCNDETLTVICQENMLNEVPITLNPSIERLILKHNRVKTVDIASFQFYASLKHIDFSYNQLIKITPQAFLTQSQLVELYLCHNQLGNVTDKTFAGLKALAVLNLRSNHLEDLPDKVFSQLPNLKELDLGHNRIQRIDPGTFVGLSMLQVLLLDDNQLTKVPTVSFQFLASLAELNIGLNAFKTLANDSFASLNSLTALDLGGAELHNITEFAFHGLSKNLRKLVLADNHLAEVPTKQLSRLTRLEELYIGQNPFSVLPENAFKGLTNLRKLVISGAPELKEVEKGAFAGNLNLESISLISNKQLSRLAEGVLTGLPNLKYLVLRDNDFGTFHETLAAWPELSKLDLSENPLQCECSLVWLRDLLFQRNTTHVHCALPAAVADRPLKMLTNEDLGCSTYVGSHQTIIGAICGVVVALIALLLFLAYRYRHKVHDAFKNYEWRKQTKTSTKQAEYQKTFNDDEFIIRTAQHQTLKPIPVTEL